MMLNSCIVIFGLILLVRTTIYRALNLLGVISSTSWGAVYAHLAPLLIRLGAIKASPVALHFHPPLTRLSVSDGFLHFGLGMPWSTRHRLARNGCNGCSIRCC